MHEAKEVRQGHIIYSFYKTFNMSQDKSKGGMRVNCRIRWWGLLRDLKANYVLESRDASLTILISSCTTLAYQKCGSSNYSAS
jgi:hypothetical protein